MTHAATLRQAGDGTSVGSAFDTPRRLADRCPITVALFISHQQNIYHAAALYAGLDRLQRRGAIAVTFRMRTPGARYAEDESVICLRVSQTGSSDTRELAIDLFDQSDKFRTSVLERCDVYFKRSYYSRDLAVLEPALRAKVRPFGLNFAGRTAGSTRSVIAHTAVGKLLRESAGIWTLYNYLCLPLLSEYERSTADPLEPSVVFQTRVWAPDQTAPGEHELLNGFRVALVHALREAFGEQFRGGLVPTSYARSLYPESLTPLPSRRRQYVAMSAGNLIGVYTRGLHQSTAFKLAEYLAAAQCIVSEVPRNELPVPLQPGVNFLPFTTAEECVAACQRLLTDSELAQRMQRANHEYYRQHVEPSANMMRVIGGCFKIHANEA